MATSVGSLQVDLALNTAAFQADMGKAAAALTTNTAAMKTALAGLEAGMRTVEGLAGALGIAFGVGEILAFTKEAAAAAAELGNVAEQVGVSTGALQAYRFAGLQAGVAQDDLDASLARLTRTIGAAAVGNDLALQAFKRLGVGILDANGQVRSTESILADVGAGFEHIQDPSEKARLAVELFGRGGQRVLSLFSQNLDDVRQHALDANVIVPQDVIDRLDEAQKASKSFWAGMAADAASAAAAVLNFKDRLTDALADLGNRTQAGGNRRGTLAGGRRAAGDLGPVGANEAAPDLPSTDAAGNPLPGPPTPRPDAGAATNPVDDFTKRQTEAAAQLVRQLELERDSVGKTNAEILRLKLSRETETRETLNGIEVVKKYTQAQVDAAVAVQEQIDVNKSVEEDINRDRERRDATLALVQANERQTQQLHEQAEAARLNTVQWDDQARAYRINADALAIVVKQQEILNQDLDITPEKAKEMATAYVNATEELRKAQIAADRNLQQINKGVSELDSFTQTTFDHVGQAIANAYIQGGTAAVNFQNIALSVLSEIEQEFIKLAFINPLKNSLFGGNNPTLGTVFGPKSDSSTGTGFAGGETSADLGTASFNGGFASGTDDAPSGLAWVGENGPELMNFRGGESVTPLSRLAGPGGGGMSIQVFDQRGSGAPVDVQQQRMPDGTMAARVFIRDETNRAVAGGVLDRTMRTSFGVQRQPVNRG